MKDIKLENSTNKCYCKLWPPGLGIKIQVLLRSAKTKESGWWSHLWGVNTNTQIYGSWSQRGRFNSGAWWCLFLWPSVHQETAPAVKLSRRELSPVIPVAPHGLKIAALHLGTIGQDAHGRNRTTFGDDLCHPFVVILGMVYIGFTTWNPIQTSIDNGFFISNFPWNFLKIPYFWFPGDEDPALPRHFAVVLAGLWETQIQKAKLKPFCAENIIDVYIYNFYIYILLHTYVYIYIRM